MIGADSILVNSRAPEKLYRCQLCSRDCVRNRELHLEAEHESIARIFGRNRAHIDVLFIQVGS